MSDSPTHEKLPLKLGHGDRRIDHVLRGWQEGNATIQAWFKENALMHDPQRYLGVVLEYVTELLDNTGHWNRFSEIRCPADIEGKYLPELHKIAGQLCKLAEAHAKPVADRIDSLTYDAFQFAVKTRLDSRLEHWKAEALGYIREGEVAQALQHANTQQTVSEISTADRGPDTQASDGEHLPGKTEPRQVPPDVEVRADQRAVGWEAIEISFLSDERVEIRSGTNTETRNYGELGFADRRAKRGKPKPNQAWVTLRALAEQNGIIQDGAKTGATWPKVEKRIQEIRKVLRKHFSITADPIQFVEGAGYHARFKIGCNPSFHT
jgi:hypothetical protein